MSKTLRDWLPPDHDITERFLDLKVIKEWNSADNAWPGPHKNVRHWCVLQTARCVGWNENPSRGWSFPMLPRLRRHMGACQ